MGLNLKSIASKLIIGGLLISIIPLIFLNFLSYNQTKKSILKISHENAKETASDLANLTNQILMSLKTQAEIISLQKNIIQLADSVENFGEDESLTQIIEVFTWLKQQFSGIGSNYQGIFITNKQGKLITGILENGEEYTGINISDFSYFKKAMESGETILSDMIISEKTKEPVIVACSPVKNSHNKIVGAIGTVIKGDYISQTVASRKIGKTGYCFMTNQNGIVIAHPNKEYILKLNISQVNGMAEIFTQMSEQKQGSLDYIFNNIEKTGGFSPVGINGWSVSTAQSKKEFLADTYRLRNVNLAIILISLTISVFLIFFLAISIVKPVNSVINGLKNIASGEGDLTRRLKVKTADETAELAKWFNIFMENLQNIIKSVKTNVETLIITSNSLSEISSTMSVTSRDSASKTKSVADSVSHMNLDIKNAVKEMQKSSSNTQAIASAAIQITSTINEIANNSSNADKITSEALKEVENASDKIRILGREAQEIDDVTNVINEIAQQVNLLALNATIEASRAGEAGRGFAVVANEIKDLSVKTAGATGSIKSKIIEIQNTSSVLVENISSTLNTIRNANDSVSEIAAAVEEQSVTTSEISSNINETAYAIGYINENITKGSKNIADISQDLKLLNNDAEKITDIGILVKNNSTDLKKISRELEEMVGRFIV